MSEILRRSRPVIAMTVALGLGVTACAGPNDINKADRATIMAEAANDGLKVVPYSWDIYNNDPVVDLTFDLGNCSIDGIAKVKLSNDYKISRVDYYGYTRYPDIGDPVSYRFQSLQDLKSNVLGPNPCRTLAANADQQ